MPNACRRCLGPLAEQVIERGKFVVDAGDLGAGVQALI
jgi:hypothetical protein